ncbi:MAG: hypothetical protein HZA91_03915 [Verrucomicrobia bacterium]|nr:hypothetical protein [Verrucomicrobiota bacterium]
MRLPITIAVSLVAAFSAAAQLAPVPPVPPAPTVAFGDAGHFTVKASREVLLRGWAAVATPGWKKWFTQAGAKSQPAEKRPDGGWNFIGWLGPRGAPLVSYSQTVLHAADTLGIAAQFRTLRETEIESLNFSLGLPARRFAGRTLRFDGRPVTLPAQAAAPGKNVFTGRPRVVAIDCGSPGVITLRFDEPQVVWVEDRRARGNDDFEVRVTLGAGKLKAGDQFGIAMQLELPARAELMVGGAGREFQNDTKDWTRFDLPWNDRSAADSDKRTATDVSGLLHTPAGRFGFLQVKDGHFAWSNGERQRFWGVCCSWGGGIPAKAEADSVAARMAKFGINMVRPKMDAPGWGDVNIVDGRQNDSQHYNAAALDEFDFFFDKLARRGIYTHLDLTWDRVFKAGDELEIDPPDKHGGLYAGGTALFTVARLAELVEKHASALLLRKNKYTGKRYVDDPAVAVVQIVNENSLFRYPEAIPKAYAKALEELWALDAGADAPPLAKCAPRHDGSGDAQWTPRATEFLAGIERKFYQRIYQHLRKIGVKCVITASNCAMGMGDSWAQAAVGDAVEINAYWDHPHQGGPAVPDGQSWVWNRPMVKSDGGYLRQFAAAAVAGKPLLITEVMNCGPNEYRAEGPLLLAAHAALQDWDGVLWFNYAESRDFAEHFNAQSPFAFDCDPARLGQFPAAARLFLGGLLAPSKLATQVVWSQSDVAAVSPWAWSGWWKIADGTPPTWLTFISRWRNRLPGINAPDPDIAIAAGRSDAPPAWPPKPRFKLAQKPDAGAAQSERLWVAAAKKLGLPLGWEEGGGRAFASDTGELVWDQDRGRFSILAPRCRAAVGFIGGQTQALGDVTIEATTPEFAAVTLVALDDEPVARSNHLLLTAAARCENTNQKWLEGLDGDVSVVGVEPGTRIEPVRTRVTFHRKTPLKVFALDATGKRGRELSVGRALDGYSITLTGETMFYEIVGEGRLKKMKELWPF